MRRIGCVGLICIALCAGGITLARRIGGTQVSPLAAIFTLPDGTPCPETCLFGVQPGKTSYDQAILLVQQHPFTRALRGNPSNIAAESLFGASDVSFMVEIAGSGNDRTVAWITLRSATGPFDQVSQFAGSLGDVLSRLGTPSGVDVESNIGTYILYADKRFEAVALRDTIEFSVNDLLFWIRLYAPGHYGDIPAVGHPQFRQWRGFRQFGSYWNAPPVYISP